MTRSRQIRGLVRELEERCRLIADTLRFRASTGNAVVTELDLASYWPGGEENKESDVRAWIFCYANYVRFNAQAEDRFAAATPSDDDVIKALADEPQSVTLQSGTTLKVYPKSFTALQRLDRWDARIAWLVRRRDVLASRDSADDIELLERLDEEISLQYGLLVAAATHPAPTLPDETELLELAKRTIAMISPVDLVILRRAHITVNALRLQMLKHHLKAAGGDPPEGHQSWQTFFVMREDDSHTPATVLMNDRSLTSQLASTVLAADIKRAAMDEAKRSQPNA